MVDILATSDQLKIVTEANQAAADARDVYLQTHGMTCKVFKLVILKGNPFGNWHFYADRNSMHAEVMIMTHIKAADLINLPDNSTLFYANTSKDVFDSEWIFSKTVAVYISDKPNTLKMIYGDEIRMVGNFGGSIPMPDLFIV
jgi:hypothetical protein